MGGPLTELSAGKREQVKGFYEKIGNICKEITGLRGFVPHEQCDPFEHPDYAPAEVDVVERRQLIENTSMLLVVTITPSWGGGIEVEIANQNNIPVVLLCEKEQLEAKRISRLLRGNPAIKATIVYGSEEEALDKLRAELKKYFPHSL